MATTKARKSTASENVTVNFEFERETKRMVRFAETDNSAGVEQVIGTLYVNKEALGTIGVTADDGQTLTVTIAVTK